MHLLKPTRLKEKLTNALRHKRTYSFTDKVHNRSYMNVCVRGGGQNQHTVNTITRQSCTQCTYNNTHTYTYKHTHTHTHTHTQAHTHTHTHTHAHTHIHTHKVFRLSVATHKDS